MAKKLSAMTKPQIITHFSEIWDLPKKDVAMILDTFAKIAIEQVIKTGSFNILGIGKLTKVKRAARVGRNPKTGESVQIAAKTVVKMRLSKACKEAMLVG